MKTTYDKKADALYISFQNGKKREKIAKTVKVNSFFFVDMGKKGEIHGIEVLNAGMHMAIPKIAISGATNKRPRKV
jgi:uncharacterized protein YuzE